MSSQADHNDIELQNIQKQRKIKEEENDEFKQFWHSCNSDLRTIAMI